MQQHLIFEGAELAGKSWIMSQVYSYLEKKDNESGFVLDGCHWFNCDIGVYGTKYGKDVVDGYINIFKTLNKKNIIVEKFYLSDKIYNNIHRGAKIDYKKEEATLKRLNFKIIFIKFPEDEKVLKKRINDRLNIYPHYKKILQKPGWYIEQQRKYSTEMNKTSLPVLEIETTKLPDDKYLKEIINWINKI